MEGGDSLAAGGGTAPRLASSAAHHEYLACTVLVAAFAAAAVGSFMECWGYSGHTVVGRYEFLPVVVLGVLTFAASVIRWAVVNGSSSKVSSQEFTGTPAAAAVTLVLILIFGVGNAFFFLARMAAGGGSPQFDRITGRYELANHGSVEVVSKSTYEAAVLNTHQLVLGFGIVFACVGAGLTLAMMAQNRRTDLLDDLQRPLSPDDTASVEGAASTVGDTPGSPPHRALITADAQGLHVNYWGRLNGGLRETNNSLLPPHLRSYDWSASWSEVTNIHQTSSRSFVIMCGEQKWAHLTIRTDHLYRRIRPFLQRVRKSTAEHY